MMNKHSKNGENQFYLTINKVEKVKNRFKWSINHCKNDKNQEQCTWTTISKTNQSKQTLSNVVFKCKQPNLHPIDTNRQNFEFSLPLSTPKHNVLNAIDLQKTMVFKESMVLNNPWFFGAYSQPALLLAGTVGNQLKVQIVQMHTNATRGCGARHTLNRRNLHVLLGGNGGFC